MIRAFRNEWRLLRREHSIWLLAAAYVLLLGYGTSQSVVRVRAVDREVRTAAVDYERRWTALKESAAKPARSGVIGAVRRWSAGLPGLR